MNDFGLRESPLSNEREANPGRSAYSDAVLTHPRPKRLINFDTTSYWTLQIKFSQIQI